MKYSSIKVKLITLFIIIKIIPLLLISYIAVNGVLLLEEYFSKNTITTIENSKQIIQNTAERAIDDSIKMLDKKSQIALEKISQQVAKNVANFLYERDNDILFLSRMPMSEKLLKRFYESKQKAVIEHGMYEYNIQSNIWQPQQKITKVPELHKSSIKDNNQSFRYTNPLNVNSISLPLYKELTFFNTKGKELYKISRLQQQKTDVSKKRNTYLGAENYFKHIVHLKKGEIYVSDVIGEYVPSKLIGTFDKKNAKKFGIDFEPSKHAYAGIENPVGRRFNGIIRFITPVFKQQKKIGYISMALDHRHIMEFTATLNPTKRNTTQDIPDASNGNYAFMWDHEGKNIAHARHYFIYGYDKTTGQSAKPWLSAEIQTAFELSKQKNLHDFLERYPLFHEQSLNKKVNQAQIKEGNIALDCRYLNFAPQCKGWMEVTKDGGYGSFIIFWSNVWKLTTAAAIPYYTGQYSQSKRGFGFVTIGANVAEFHEAAMQTKQNINTILKSQTQNMQGHLKQSSGNIKEFIDKIIQELSIITVLMIIGIIFIAILLSNYLSKKLQNLLIGTQKFANNELHYKIDVHSNDEIGQLEHSFNDMSEKISTLIEEKEAHNLTLKTKVKEAIEKTKEKEQIIREKDNILAQQSKMAAMGEMIENIAHQWRQPLSIISTNITGLKMKQQLGMLEDKDIDPVVQSTTDSVKYLSNTIDDFRNFFKTNKDKELFNIKDCVQKSLSILNSKFKTYDIQIIQNMDDVVIESYENELIQVLMNLFNNAKDQFLLQDMEERFIFITLETDKKSAFLHIRDNALGIKQENITRVFEPYFTTKHKAQGTGIGLHMSREIITKHMNGTIEVDNSSFQYKKRTYKGAKFTITLPLK